MGVRPLLECQVDVRKLSGLLHGPLILAGEYAHDSSEAACSKITSDVRPFDEHTFVFEVNVLIKHSNVCRR